MDDWACLAVPTPSLHQVDRGYVCEDNRMPYRMDGDGTMENKSGALGLASVPLGSLCICSQYVQCCKEAYNVSFPLVANSGSKLICLC